MDLGLDGRVYVITGGSSGLGFATAQALVADGARVIVSARDADRLKVAAAALGPTAVAVPADLADRTAPAALVEAAFDSFGRLDGALVSSGGPPATRLLDTTDEQWEQAFASVFLGAVRTATTVANRLDRGGAVGLVLSTSARSPIPGLALSNGLRPGLAMAAKTLADEVGPDGVRVFGLAPGLIRSERIRALHGDDATASARAAQGVPLRRIGEPEEFGRVAAFLLSPAASYVTGCVVPVDGGSLRVP